MLSLRDVHVHIGKLHILQGVTLELKQGESVALLGRNGVGKTTTLRSIMGLVGRSAGVIEFDGDDLAKCQPHLIPRKGIGYVPQGRGIFPTLSVLENLNIGLPGKRDSEREDYVLTCFPRLKERLKQSGSTLSGGEQQMLAIARCLMGRPELIMFDEPSLGLAPAIVQEVFRIIQSLRGRGITILLVEQNVALSLKLSQRAYVLENGEIVMSGTGEALLHDDRVRRAYLGL